MEKKQELVELRKKKLEGSFIRSRTKWISDGEKLTKYFCNLENRNFISKHMVYLYSKSGQLLALQEDILKEAVVHYKSLYSFREVDNIDLSDCFGSTSIRKLSDQVKMSLEGKLTHGEMLSSLKKISNDSSPGNSGFTAAFFIFFFLVRPWTFLTRSINNAFDTK